MATQGSFPVYYWLVRATKSNYRHEIRPFLIEFEDARRRNRDLVTDPERATEADPELTEYDRLSRSINDQGSLEGRFDILNRRFQAYELPGGCGLTRERPVRNSASRPSAFGVAPRLDRSEARTSPLEDARCMAHRRGAVLLRGRSGSLKWAALSSGWPGGEVRFPAVKVTTVRLPDEVADALDAEARRVGTSRLSCCVAAARSNLAVVAAASATDVAKI